MRTSVLVTALIVTACTQAPVTAPTPQVESSASLYIPRDVRQAYLKGTRSPDGKPGPNYWQNRARYNIAITASPPSRTVSGTEDITYYNNSPDTIRNPVISLDLHLHKPGAPRAGGARAEYLTSGVQIDSMAVNGKATKWPGT